MNARASKSFIFNNTAAELYPLTMAVVDFLKQERSVGQNEIQKVKLVLMELLTNSLKHCGGVQTTIEAAVSNERIILTRTDAGNPIAITSDGCRLEWPLPGNHHAGRTIYFYGDDSGTLSGALKNNCHIQFFIEETGNNETDMLNLPEHFGLMILTKASSSFEYEFNIDTLTNKFTAVIPLATSI